MAAMQLKDNRRPWILNEKNLVSNLYYKLPSAYTFYGYKK